MPTIRYVDHDFSAASRRTIDLCNGIIRAYAAQGFDLTLRQLYYQCVSRELIANTDREYKRLGSVINDARLAGLVDWDAITDRTRHVRANAHWTDPAGVIRSALASYRLDLWEGQARMVEVWIEKDALIGVIAAVCGDLDVPYFSCRGYTSQSEMWGAAQRLLGYAARGMLPLVLHLGDHDPSGVDMTRDITDRLSLFTDGAVDVRRIALTPAQIARYNPPPNPAKISDSRADGYIAAHGDHSWELDALEPAVIAAVIRRHVIAERDPDVYRAQRDRQERDTRTLRAASEQWAEVVQGLHARGALPLLDIAYDDGGGADSDSDSEGED